MTLGPSYGLNVTLTPRATTSAAGQAPHDYAQWWLPQEGMVSTEVERKIAGAAVEIVEGDIADQAGFDAVVNAANAELMIGGGVAGAIHRTAGPELAEECRPLAPLRPGESVITGGHRLPNRHVIHCLGPVYGVDEPADALLGSCYESALDLAERHALTSVAFPAISTGAFGYPLQAAAEIALATVLRSAKRLRSVRRIRFVLSGSGAVKVHREVLDRLTMAE